MHVDKSSGINQNHDKIELQQKTHQNQQSSIFGNGFPDKDNNGIVNKYDFDDDSIIQELKNKNLFGCFWGDVYNEVNDIVHFSEKKLEVKTNVLQEIKRNDGYNIRIVNINNSLAVLQIQAKDKPTVNISLFLDSDVSEIDDNDVYHRYFVNNENSDVLLKTFINALQELRTNVLEDLSQEVQQFSLKNKLKLGLDGSAMGIHHDSWIELSQETVLEGYNLSHVLSHEVGHALDYDFEEPPFYASRTKEYKEKFIKFKELTLSLLNKYNLNDISRHMIGGSNEDFACRYARIEGGSTLPTDNDIVHFVSKFKDSNDPEEKECYEAHIELDNLAQKIIKERRQKQKVDKNQQ